VEAGGAAARRFLPWIRAAAVVDVAIGVVVLAGWLWDVRVLKQVSPDLPTMKPNTAAMLIVAALGILAVYGVADGRRLRLGVMAGCFVVVVAGLTVVEYVWRDLGIDQLVFHDAKSAYPGRSSPHTALVFLLVGLNLVALGAGRLRRWAPYANGAAAAALGFGLIGYAFNVDYFRSVSAVNGISVQTLVGATLAILALALIEPRKGWIGVVTAPGPGGHMARLFAPIVIGAPILLGLAQRSFDSTWARAITAAGVTAIAVLALFQAAMMLERSESERVQLAGLLPICSHCRRIRDEQGYWSALETYVETHADVSFSHGLCSSCLAEHYPDVAERVEQRRAEAEA
jgi:hypothetical protein